MFWTLTASNQLQQLKMVEIVVSLTDDIFIRCIQLRQFKTLSTI